VFEAKDDVGGLWYFKDLNPSDPNYEEKKNLDNYYRLYNNFYNSMYDDLVTNLPYFFMEYKDLPMVEVDPNIPSFITVTQFKRYLDAYADKFELRKFIQFNTLVKSVRLYQNLSEEEKSQVKSPRKFLVKTSDAIGDNLKINEQMHSFDYIMVTCGQYSRPYIPDVPNLDSFKGNVMHCKDFRTIDSEIFRGKKVLLVGGGSSAIDLLIQIFASNDKRKEDCEKVVLCSRSVKHIYASNDFKSIVESGKLVLHQGTIEKIKEGNTVCFTDGTEEEIDTIYFATGFKFTFPFFDFEKDNIISHNENEHRGAYFGPTYKKLIAIREPDVFFIGFIEQTTLVHILSELQVLAAKYIIEGKLKMPSQEEMLESFEKETEDNLKIVGDLAHFYKFPRALPNNEMKEWAFFSDWLKPVHPNNNEEKGRKFMELVDKARAILWGGIIQGDFLKLKKRDYNEIYPRDFINTSDFV